MDPSPDGRRLTYRRRACHVSHDVLTGSASGGTGAARLRSVAVSRGLRLAACQEVGGYPVCLTRLLWARTKPRGSCQRVVGSAQDPITLAARSVLDDRFEALAHHVLEGHRLFDRGITPTGSSEITFRMSLSHQPEHRLSGSTTFRHQYPCRPDRTARGVGSHQRSSGTPALCLTCDLRSESR